MGRGVQEDQIMKTQYEHIYFEQDLTPSRRKTQIWACRHVGNEISLGEVRWHPPWRQYCFFPQDQTIYASSCLRDIQDFIRQLMAARKR